MSDYVKPTPTGKSKAEIYEISEKFASQVGFLPGDRIEPLIERLGGKLKYLSDVSSIEAADGSLFVDGPNDFKILVSAFTGAERDRFTIAHELGHYVLHSKKGTHRIQAARFGSSRVEWEANWFAAAFLMPEKDFKATAKKYHRDSNLIAARYLVSPAAAEVRMKALGIPVGASE